ncbi:MAG: LptF/LptG family permease [Flavobacteriales bacterium]
MLKTIDKLILKAFLKPFLATFTALQFIFLMQFVWKILDDLVGKGLSLGIILELLYYANFSLIPLTLPLSVLLSSIMSTGSLSEHFELTALKASGVSFLRILRPLFFVAIGLSFTAFIFSNNLIPWSYLKQKTLFRDIARKKFEVKLIEGVFFTDAEGLSIRVNKKHDDGERVEDITIYKQSVKGNIQVVKAEKGKIHFTPDRHYLLIDLFDGYSYEELYRNRNDKNEAYPHSKIKFKHQLIRMDMSPFALGSTDEDLFKFSSRSMNVSELSLFTDSIYKQVVDYRHDIDNKMSPVLHVFNPKLDSLVFEQHIELADSSLIAHVLSKKHNQTYAYAQNLINSSVNRIKSGRSRYDRRFKYYRQAIIQWHKKFTLSISVLILFMVGAPLGAIIKRGGMGMPLVVSVLFFIAYYMLSTYGERSVLKNKLDYVFGMWITNLSFLPFGILFMYQSATDSPLFDKDFYLRKIRSWRKK